MANGISPRTPVSPLLPLRADRPQAVVAVAVTVAVAVADVAVVMPKLSNSSEDMMRKGWPAGQPFRFEKSEIILTFEVAQMDFNRYMKTTRIFLFAAALMAGLFMTACGSTAGKSTAYVNTESPQAESVVYFTKDISPESLVKVYEALGVVPSGRVAVKISTGESEKSNNLDPALIADLVRKVNGTLVECNTAYGGSRATTESHRAEIAKRGYNDIAVVDIMDEEGEIKIPVKDTKWIQYDIVGSHLQNYDFLINLAHFKGHAMGGFGGVLKNQSIGVASANGKVNIHSAGKHEQATPDGDLHAPSGWFLSPEKNTPFIESMAAAAQGVHDYFKGKVLYIDVMNNLSIDCDCDGNPHEPTIRDIGIAASLDPVALDKFCLDRVFNLPVDADNDTKALLDRINQRHGLRIVYRAEENGLGSTAYRVVSLD